MRPMSVCLCLPHPLAQPEKPTVIPCCAILLRGRYLVSFLILQKENGHRLPAQVMIVALSLGEANGVDLLGNPNR